MQIRKNIGIIDTETTGDFGTPLIYDIGWVVLDKELKITEVKEYLVKEVFETNFLMNTAFYKSKRPMYLDRVAKEEIDSKPMREIIKELIKDFKKGGVKVLSAYNVSFDVRALRKTIEVVASDMLDAWDKFITSISTLCIWDTATDTLLQNEDFKTVAYEQGWISEKGNFQTNAEVAYRYLTKDYNFEESHTALADVLVEYDILYYCLTNYKGRANYGLSHGSWRKVQDKTLQKQNIARYQELKTQKES